jgi:hypothetical protein
MSQDILSVHISIFLKICLLSLEIISTSKNLANSTDSLLLPVAVAHHIITIQFGFSFLKFSISNLDHNTMSSNFIFIALG